MWLANKFNGYISTKTNTIRFYLPNAKTIMKTLFNEYLTITIFVQVKNQRGGPCTV